MKEKPIITATVEVSSPCNEPATWKKNHTQSYTNPLLCAVTHIFTMMVKQVVEVCIKVCHRHEFKTIAQYILKQKRSAFLYRS